MAGGAAGNRGNGLELINSHDNTIGGDTAAERNVISANSQNGIQLSRSSNNSILGNYIGTNTSGTAIRESPKRDSADQQFEQQLDRRRGRECDFGQRPGRRSIAKNSSTNTLASNLIGLNAAGTAAIGNGGDGIRVKAASGNLIGHDDPVSSVTYFDGLTATDVTQPLSAWQGIRGTTTAGQYMMVGTSNSSDGLLYVGSIDGNSGTSYTVTYPGSVATSVYGPDAPTAVDHSTRGQLSHRLGVGCGARVHLRGNDGRPGNAGNYLSIDYPGAEFNYVHSTMGGLAVGNYDSPTDHGQGGLPLGPGHAYIYDIASDTFLTDVVYPGSTSNTAYGIWYNGGTSYTIFGGYSNDPVNNFADQDQPIGPGYLVDYDSATGNFTNWKSFTYPNGNELSHPLRRASAASRKGVYTLNADSVQTGTGDPAQGSWVDVRRNTDGSFGDGRWVNLNYPNLNPTTHVTSSNSVYGNQVVGIVIGVVGIRRTRRP